MNVIVRPFDSFWYHVGDHALTDEHVPHLDGPVVEEFLLAVEDEAALGHERPEDRRERVARGVSAGCISANLPENSMAKGHVGGAGMSSKPAPLAAEGSW